MEIFKKKMAVAPLVIAILLLSTFAFPVVGKKPKHMVFQGIANGQGGIVWGLGSIPQYYWGEIEYIEVFDKGSFSIAGMGMLANLETSFGADEAWKLQNIKVLPIVKVRWSHDGETHNLQVKLKITEETDCIYLKYEKTPWGRPEGVVQTALEAMIIGLNLEKETTEEMLDTQYATMTFKGTLDGQEIEGKATVEMWHVDEYNDNMIWVNLWINNAVYDDLYVLFTWFPWNSLLTDITVPAATVLKVQTNTVG
jgi:hypothetical protein